MIITDEDIRIDFWTERGLKVKEARTIIKNTKPTLNEAAYIFQYRFSELALAIKRLF